MNSGYFTIRKGGGVEARRLMRVLVEPEADRILWRQVRVLLMLEEGRTRRSLKTPLFSAVFLPRLGAVIAENSGRGSVVGK